MASLFLFANNLPLQLPSEAYGVIDNNQYRLTSCFNMANAASKAYAIFKGHILLQQQADTPNKVNLILKPHDTSSIKLPVKYVIYRGLSTDSFLTATDITASTTKVKTSGSELINAMQQIQQQRSPGTDIPLQALFGFSLAPDNNMNIDHFFYNKQSSTAQFFLADGGLELGNFAAGTCGIEIILENPEYLFTVAIAKKAVNILNISGLTNTLAIKWNKDLIRHFVDPAAFYGFHYDISGGIEYRDSSGNKQTANSSGLVATQILNQFNTKNRVYLDIRNENGYSYNYYNNYVGTTGIASDDSKELKTGVTAASLEGKEYATNGWPIHIVDTLTAGAGNFFLALRINDNERPLLISLNTDITPFSVEYPSLEIAAPNRVLFIDELILLSSPVSPVLPEFTNAVDISIPNVQGGETLATIVRLEYIKQLRLNDTADLFPLHNPTDYLFGPVNIQIPWDSQDNIQWIAGSHHKYYDGVNHGFIAGTLEETVNSFNAALKTVTLNQKIEAQLANKIMIANTEYHVQKVETTTSTTIITLREELSGLQAGATLQCAVEVAVVIDYVNNKLIAPDIDLTFLDAFSANKKVRLSRKKGTESDYIISNISYISGNTEITVADLFKKQGFGAIMQTGMVSETVISSNNDNILFYAAPLYYFENTGGENMSFFNYKGKTGNGESFIKMVKKHAQGFTIEKYILQLTQGNTIATLAYNEQEKLKEDIFLLGFRSNEFNVLKAAAENQLSPCHLQMLVLVPQGDRLRDENYEPYYHYHAVIAGLNSTGNYAQTTAYQDVYSKDGMVFTSSGYASNTLAGFIPGLNSEEKYHLITNWEEPQFSGNNNSTFKYLYEELGIVLKTIVNNFKSAIDALSNTVAFKNQIENIIKQRGSELFNTACTKIQDNTSPMYHKDGALYLARLQMRKILKEHPLISSSAISNTELDKYLALIEKATRGLHESNRPDFSAYPNHIPILISGFDPFRAAMNDGGLDKDEHLSNSSGDLALSLNNMEIVNGTKTAIIKSVIFPVRYKEFDEGWIENFFEPYINPNHQNYQQVKMIITFSYGDILFTVDRFASRYRFCDINLKDNNEMSGAISIYLNSADKNDLEFIETKLPYIDLVTPNAADLCVVLHQKAKFWYYKDDKRASSIPKAFNNYNTSPLEPFPNITNYPPAISSIVANKIKAMEGSGGNYLSNEIFYRVAFLRQKFNPTLKTGHIHVSYHKEDLDTNRVNMINEITQAIIRTLLNL